MRSIFNIRAGRLSPLILLAALLLGAALLSGCGGDDEGNETAASTQAEAPADSTGADTTATTTPADREDEKEAGDDSGSSESEPDSEPAEKEPSDDDGGEVAVPPNRHKDSGGGSKQFRTKGGDNSIQNSGSEADSATFDEVAAIVHAFLDSRAAGDAAATCRYLSSSITDQLLQFAEQSPEAPKTCEGLVDAFTVPMDRKTKRRIAQADIGSVRVKDDTAFVLYRGAEKMVYVLPMAREDGQWKVAALAGSPIL